MTKMMKPKHQKSALLCDASFSAIPLLQALKAKGLFVAVCGSRAGDPCHELADASFDIDYSNKKKLLKIVADNHFDYLVPGCTDVSYISCAWVANQLGLPGYDGDQAVRVMNHKNEYRKFGKAMGYPIPAYETSVENFKKVSFPALLKPINSFSGRGIIKFDKYSSLRSFIDRGELLAIEGSVLLEEFAKGDLYSHSAFLKSGKIFTDFFVNEYCTVHPYQVNSSYVSTKLGVGIQKNMRAWLENFAKDLNLVDGLLHTQFISDGKRIYLVESCRRCPGDLYSLLIQKTTSINYASLFVSPFVGSPFSRVTQVRRRNYSRHTLSIDRDVIFMSARMALENSKISYVPIKKPGEPLRAAPMDRAGIFFIESPSKCTMESLTRNLYKVAKIEVLDLK